MSFASWANSSAWTTAGWIMLHFLWVGAALTVVAALGRSALRKAHPDVRYGSALATLAALAVAPVVIACTIAEAPRTADANTRQARMAVEPTIALEAPRSIETHANPSVYLNKAVRLLPGVWLAGAPWMFAYLVAGLLGAERLRRRSRVVGDPELSALASRLAGSLGIARRVTVGVCDRIAGPMLLGIARPLILMPAAALSGWTPGQVEIALLHELAHVRRWDNLVNLIQRMVEAVLFFHPAVWLVSGWVRRDREHCCDRIVVDYTGRPFDYAVALFALVEAGDFNAPCVHASFMGRNNLVDRIRRILNPEEPAMRLSRSVVALAALTLAVPAILFAAYVQHPSAQSPEPTTDPAAEARQAKDEALAALIPARIRELLRRDPAVEAILQEVRATEDELGRAAAVGRRPNDPAVVAVRRRLDRLNAKYVALMSDGYVDIRRQVMAGASIGSQEQVEKRIRYLFKLDPAVASLTQDIRAAQEELEHNNAISRGVKDPARIAARKRLDQLKATYEDIWKERYPKIHRQVTGGWPSHAASAPE